MNGNFIGNFGNFSSLGLGDLLGGQFAGPLQQGASSLGGPEGGFTDLLDLIGDLEVADGQSGELDKLLEIELSAGKLEDVVPQATLPTMGLGSSASLVQMFSKDGAWVDQGTKDSALPSVVSLGGTSELAQEAMLELGDLKVASPSVRDQIGRKQVEAWALPLLSGDLKEVNVGAELKTASQRILQHQQQLPEFSQDIVQSHVLSEGASAEGNVNAGLIKPARTLATDKIDLFATYVAKESFGPVSESAKIGEALVQSRVAELNDGSSNGPKEKSLSGQKKGVAVGASMKASEFFARGLDGEVQTKGSFAHQEVVRMPEALLQPGDSRVSTQALSFIANKVDQLKLQGGGQLTVRLNPVELGEVRIDVRKTLSGETAVQLTALNPETQKLFQDSSAELRNKLADMGATLEVTAEAPLVELKKPQVAAHRSEMMQASADSQGFLKSREARVTGSQDLRGSQLGADLRPQFEAARMGVSSGGRAEVSSVSVESLTSSQRQESHGSFDAHSRREDARQRWREQFDQRESA